VQQIFGPVVVVHKIDDEEEALKLANDSECERTPLRHKLATDANTDGLFGTIFTRDLDRALRFARRLESGTVGINITSPVRRVLRQGQAQRGQVILPDMPAGGYKSSGIGREYGAEAVLDWTEKKTVLIKANL
jgi:aldehyde dehydrogenase (NAD+)